jgi:hypothetical protein
MKPNKLRAALLAVAPLVITMAAFSRPAPINILAAVILWAAWFVFGWRAPKQLGYRIGGRIFVVGFGIAAVATFNALGAAMSDVPGDEPGWILPALITGVVVMIAGLVVAATLHSEE